MTKRKFFGIDFRNKSSATKNQQKNIPHIKQ